MVPAQTPRRSVLVPALLVLLLTGLVLWLRWPTFGASLWNVDEAIHAAAARTILDGGVLYRDALDIRHPLSYYAVAALFALFGENNLWAVRGCIAALIVATSVLLFLAGRAVRGAAAGAGAAVLYATLTSSVLYPGDAYAANTEWFVAFFSSAACAVFLTGGPVPSPRRLFLAGLLFSCAFLSKQPALLDLAAPLAALAYAAWRQASPGRLWWGQLLALSAGWLAPVLFTLGYFAVQGALRDALFYTWTYNLTYYGPEIAAAGRILSLATPFQLIGGSQSLLLVLWAVGALFVLHRLVQRTPTPQEETANPGLVFVTVWTLASLIGAASSGRTFDHYTIQFLAPFCLGAGLVLSRVLAWVRSAAQPRTGRIAAALLLVGAIYQLVPVVLSSRGRTLPDDPSHRVSAYIREHSAPADRIFVWGFHSDIYLYADRRPASRHLFGAFVTGLIPWTNTAPALDTGYAVVPGSMDTLIRDLTARPPVFIVDCSAGPNRFWQKYPPENYPALHEFIRSRYRQVEPHRFVPQGFRLYGLVPAGESTGADPANPPLPAAVAATLKLGTVASPLTPIRASARHGASLSLVEGRLEYFAHAPATIVYRIPAGAAALRGGYGFKPSAYAGDNAAPTDGAEFIIRWRPAGGAEQVLLRRLLRPREEPADRGVHSFRVSLPAHQGGELELDIGPGPSGLATSDWTHWTDLLLENFPLDASPPGF